MATKNFCIAAAQVPSVRGDLDTNFCTHRDVIEAAAAYGVSVLVFPELSLTGYEPDLAADLATTPNDVRFEPLRSLARKHSIEVIAGMPLSNKAGKPYLGAIVFGADGGTLTYAKMHLGTSERPYFSPGATRQSLRVQERMIGLAICADSSEPSHPQGYAEAGASVYAAGVFLNAEWYSTDAPRLAGYAASCRLLVVMANHGESFGTHRSVGRSAVWAPDGTLLSEAVGTVRCLVTATFQRGSWSGGVLQLT